MRICALMMLLVLSMAARVSAEEPAAGKQVEMKFDSPTAGGMPYLLYLPKGYGDEPAKKWPVMMFLHGSGERNGPLSIVKKWGPPRIVGRGEDLPYILISPQCPRESRWTSAEQQAGLLELLASVQKTYSTDDDRVYLTGLSMGGFGAWKLAADHGDKFAAVAPLCGKGDPANGEKLKSVPIWAFHGTEDGAVPFRHSVEMVEAIKKAGGTKVQFTSLEGVGHNCWSAAYATQDLFSWFDKHTRSGNK